MTLLEDFLEELEASAKVRKKAREAERKKARGVEACRRSYRPLKLSKGVHT